MHQRARDVDQPAAPQHPIRQFENMQTDGVSTGGLVITDKALGLQSPQDVVRGPAVQARAARDLARVQRAFGRVQNPENFAAATTAPTGFPRGPICAIGDEREGMAGGSRFSSSAATREGTIPPIRFSCRPDSIIGPWVLQYATGRGKLLQPKTIVFNRSHMSWPCPPASPPMVLPSVPATKFSVLAVAIDGLPLTRVSPTAQCRFGARPAG